MRPIFVVVAAINSTTAVRLAGVAQPPLRLVDHRMTALGHEETVAGQLGRSAMGKTGDLAGDGGYVSNEPAKIHSEERAADADASIDARRTDLETAAPGGSIGNVLRTGAFRVADCKNSWRTNRLQSRCFIPLLIADTSADLDHSS